VKLQGLISCIANFDVSVATKRKTMFNEITILNTKTLLQKTINIWEYTVEELNDIYTTYQSHKDYALLYVKKPINLQLANYKSI